MQEDRKNKDEEDEDDNDDGLGIQVVATRAAKHKCPPIMQQIGICHPFSMSIYGTSGSGKTVFAINLLKDPKKYGGYFDEIHLFGLTVRSDDSWKNLDVKKEHIHDEIEKMIPELKQLLAKQRRDVEAKGVLACKKICIVFEDVTTNIKLLNASAYHQAYVQNRHNAVSSIAMCHKYNAQNRTCRLNSGHSILFPCAQSDIDRLITETQPAGLSKREYEEIIMDCFTPEEGCSHPFMWLNSKVEESMKIRKTLRHIIRYN